MTGKLNISTDTSKDLASSVRTVQ